jgi:hypothetical protein
MSVFPLLAATTATAIVWLTVGLVSTLAFAIMRRLGDVLLLMRAVDSSRRVEPDPEEMTTRATPLDGRARSSGGRSTVPEAGRYDTPCVPTLRDEHVQHRSPGGAPHPARCARRRRATSLVSRRSVEAAQFRKAQDEVKTITLGLDEP